MKLMYIGMYECKNNDRCSIDIASSKVVISLVSRCYRCLLVVVFSNISNNYNSHNSNTSINIMYGSPQYVMIPSFFPMYLLFQY